MAKTPESLDAKIVLLGEEHSGRDEMNLAGNPFALLQHDSRHAHQSVIEYEWERKLPNGKLVKASWRVSGDSELGLPGPSDELLYLVLLELTREAAQNEESGAWPQTVAFSRYDLMERLGWGKSARDYRLLRDCFTRLQAVSIRAEHAFWDARTKAPFAAVGFNIIDEYSLADEPKGRKSKTNRGLPLSSFKWSDRLHASFQSGNVRSLALSFILSLETPTARRLFRLLEVFRNAQTPPRQSFSIGLIKLRDRLGMVNLRYNSKIKERLQISHDELIARGYLESVEYTKSKDGDILVVYSFGNVKKMDENAQSLAPITRTPTGKNIVPKEKAPAKSRAKSTHKKGNNQPSEAKGVEVLPRDIRYDAMRCHSVFQALSETEREELLEIAKQSVSPIWHDRIGQPESPMSLGLWELVAQRYPERVQEEI
jgi:plasmid replication initiation protein